MELAEVAKEAVALGVAGIAGAWTVYRHAAAKHEALERRIDQLARGS